MTATPTEAPGPTPALELDAATRRRLKWARSNTYRGWIYEQGGKPRDDDWVTLRIADFDALRASCASRAAQPAGEVELREALAKAEARTSGIFEALEAAVEQFSEPMSLLNAHELGERLASDVAEIARHGRARTALAALSPPPELVAVEELRAELQGIVDHATVRRQDGIEMGAAVWRIALEDIAREARSALARTARTS